MFEYASDPKLTKYVIFATHQSLAESAAVIGRLIAETASGQAMMWGLTERQNDRLIGTCGFGHFAHQHRRAELGYALNRQFWNQGLMTEAVRAVIRFGFTALGLNRIEARCFVENPASARVLEKAGMVFEGVLREHVQAKGRFVDLKMYSILYRDWVAAIAGPD